jgi:hypothetical protein
MGNGIASSADDNGSCETYLHCKVFSNCLSFCSASSRYSSSSCSAIWLSFVHWINAFSTSDQVNLGSPIPESQLPVMCSAQSRHDLISENHCAGYLLIRPDLSDK